MTDQIETTDHNKMLGDTASMTDQTETTDHNKILGHTIQDGSHNDYNNSLDGDTTTATTHKTTY